MTDGGIWTYVSAALNVVLTCSLFSSKWDEINVYHETLNDFKVSVREIESNAIEYWSSDNPDDVKLVGQQLISDIFHLIRESQSLSNRHKLFKNDLMEPHISYLQKIITGGTFQVSNRLPDTTRIENIRESTLNLCGQVDTFYIKHKILWVLAIWARI